MLLYLGLAGECGYSCCREWRRFDLKRCDFSSGVFFGYSALGIVLFLGFGFLSRGASMQAPIIANYIGRQ